MSDADRDNLKARSTWNTNAEFWDGRMGEGNEFFNVLVWPAVERLLRPEANAWILDIACGNGVTSRRLAHAGASVVAIDFAEKLIELAKARSPGRAIEYHVVDATDGQALLSLGETRFDGALCNMALMDIADLHPLMKALGKLLRPGGAFVFSVLHPCFNNPAAVQRSAPSRPIIRAARPRSRGAATSARFHPCSSRA
jgi:2-polyprenyl-3-methyl-5-hydroxy-6-metoxy-1,4-benzoquinol methylase